MFGYVNRNISEAQMRSSNQIHLFCLSFMSFHVFLGDFPIFLICLMPFLQLKHCQTILFCGVHNLPAPGRSFGAHHPCSAIFLRQLRRELGPTGLSSDAAEDLTYNYLGFFRFLRCGRVIGIYHWLYPIYITWIYWDILGYILGYILDILVFIGI